MMGVYQKQPPIWLFMFLPLLLLCATISLYQWKALSVVTIDGSAASNDGPNLNGTVIDEGTEALSQENPIESPIDEVTETLSEEEPVESTIIRDVPHDEYIAVCLLAKDQALDMVEFFEHHYYEMGIRRFWVMDDASDPPLSTFQYEYGIPYEAIDFVYHPKTTDIPFAKQIPIIDYCLQTHAGNHSWVAVIDADEFIDTPGPETLEEILRDFEETRPDVGAIGVNWQMHTSNGQIHRVESSRKTYLECISDGEENMGESGNKHVKSILRPEAYASPQNPHTFNLQPGFITVGEHGDAMPQSAFRQPITRDRLSLQHYVLKSWEDYYDKTSRSGKDWNFWNLMEYKLEHVACPQMLRYFAKPPNRPHSYKER